MLSSNAASSALARPHGNAVGSERPPSYRRRVATVEALRPKNVATDCSRSSGVAPPTAIATLHHGLAQRSQNRDTDVAGGDGDENGLVAGPYEPRERDEAHSDAAVRGEPGVRRYCRLALGGRGGGWGGGRVSANADIVEAERREREVQRREHRQRLDATRAGETGCVRGGVRMAIGVPGAESVCVPVLCLRRPEPMDASAPLAIPQRPLLLLL